MRQPPENSRQDASLRRLIEAEAGENAGGACRGRVGADVREAQVNVGDTIGVGRGLGLGE